MAKAKTKNSQVAKTNNSNFICSVPVKSVGPIVTTSSNSYQYFKGENAKGEEFSQRLTCGLGYEESFLIGKDEDCTTREVNVMRCNEQYFSKKDNKMITRKVKFTLKSDQPDVEEHDESFFA